MTNRDSHFDYQDNEPQFIVNISCQYFINLAFINYRENYNDVLISYFYDLVWRGVACHTVPPTVFLSPCACPLHVMRHLQARAVAARSCMAGSWCTPRATGTLSPSSVRCVCCSCTECMPLYCSACIVCWCFSSSQAHAHGTSLSA